MANDNFQQQNNPEVQQAVNAALQEEKKKKKKKKLMIFGVIFAVIVIIIVAAGSSGSSDNAKTDTGKNTTTSSVNAEKEETDDNTVGDFKCVVKKAEITKDWDGKDAVIITYDFTNNSDDPYSFDGALTDKVFQDGIELEIATMTDDDEAKWFDTVDIKPGITKEVKKAYKLRNKKSDLEIEISETFSFSDDKITTTVKL